MWEFFEKVLDERGYVVLLVGTLIFSVGALGQFGVWFSGIPEGIRWSCIGFGGLVILFSLYLLLTPDRRTPYGVRILDPSLREHVPLQFNVKGEMRRRGVPKGKELWLLRIYPDHDKFVPMKRVTPRPDGTWDVTGCNLGGEPREKRIIGAYLVEESALVLFKYFDDASQLHNKWMDDKNVPTNARNRYLPPIVGRPANMTNMKKCYEVEVIRA